MNSDHLGTRRVLVTGATGFIGSHLIRRLVRDGWETHIIARPGSTLRSVDDVRSKIKVHVHDGATLGLGDIMAEARPTVVYHLASLFLADHRSEDVESLVRSNLLFGTQLAEAMVKNGAKLLVNAGTSWQHYQGADYDPVNLYAAIKQAFEDILKYYIEAHGLRVVNLTIFDTYGPNDPRPKLFALLRRAEISREKLLMSPGEQLIDLVYIDDVIDACICSVQVIPDSILGFIRYGVSSGQLISLKDLVSTYEKITGVRLQIVWGGRQYRHREVMRPWSRYQSVPGWTPKVSLVEGIRRIFQ